MGGMISVAKSVTGVRVIRHITAAQKRWERAEERKALAEFRARSPEERQRMLEAMRRMAS